MIRVRLTDAQIGAVMCRDWSEEPVMRRQLFVHDLLRNGCMQVLPSELDALADEVNEASNAEDAHAIELRHEGHLDCARHAARSARVLANLRAKILDASSSSGV